MVLTKAWHKSHITAGRGLADGALQRFLNEDVVAVSGGYVHRANADNTGLISIPLKDLANSSRVDQN